MSDAKKQVLVVDDSPTDIQFIIENLKDEFALQVASSGTKALALAQQNSPDAILMDVSMPELNGYETCARLKENPSTRDVEVLFVSANDSTEEILNGYEVGGCDYIVKPVNPEELRRKVRLATQHTAARASMASEKQAARDAAMTAIADAAEQAFVVSFLRESFQLNSFQSLARHTVLSTAKFGLANTVLIQTPDEEHTHSTADVIPPLEIELIQRLSASGRLLERGKRLIINFPMVSMLIKNMPDDPDKCGRLRDHIALIMEGASSCARNLLVRTEASRLIKESNQTLNLLQQLEMKQKQKNIHIMDRMQEDIQQSFPIMGLSEYQEDMLNTRIREAVDHAVENFEVGLKIDEQLKIVIERVQDATLKIDTLQDAATNQVDDADPLLASLFTKSN